MPKQLNQIDVNLQFTADTHQVEKNIQDLKASLASISNIKAPAGMSLKKDIQEAVNSAKSLQLHLNKAFDIKTGNFDLNKLNASLKASGQTLSQLSNGLLKAGLEGEKAFMNVQKGIANSSVQLTKANGLLNNFLITLKNTARWQFSSSMLHGFMGSMSAAYNYAKDLDRSLNNIRIVTGNSAEEMATFADNANKAAKALSTTTTKYTDAALIYYQQGLSDQEVLERTDTTIKLANVVGENAQQVSDQLTAIWNNFDDGSQSAEYYADVITALGAATASSTDEIAQGIEKFAAVADTIGLSYEYATSALATVTSQTRQSADVVGTAFKTIFARIQGLKLGDTLEDGTNLNKYSEALQKVGISIFTQQGQLKNMDVILSEMGEKWETLNKSQQVALAQTVAGTRQYNQLVSLMDDWDIFEQNLNIAQGSEGTLQEQADIYEESWKAAHERVKASAESLYNELIPTDFIIDLTDGFANVLDGVTSLVQGLGGLESILMIISTIVLNRMGPSITNGINSTIEKVSLLDNSFQHLGERIKNTSSSSTKLTENINKINSTGLNSATKQVAFFNENLKQGANESLRMQQSMIETAASQNILSDSFSKYLADVSKVYNIQGLIAQNSARLTEAEKEQLSIMQQKVLQAAELKAKRQEELDSLLFKKDQQQDVIDPALFESASFKGNSFESSLVSSEGIAKQWRDILGTLSGVDDLSVKVQGNVLKISSANHDVSNVTREAANSYQHILEINQQIADIANDMNIPLDQRKDKIHEIIEAEKQSGTITAQVVKSYNYAADHLKKGANGANGLNAALKQVENRAQRMAQAFGNSPSFLGKIKNLTVEIFSTQKGVNEATDQHNTLLATTGQLLTNAVGKAQTYGGAISKMLSGFSTVAMGLNSVQNMISTLGDSEASTMSKLTSVAMGASMGFAAFSTTLTGVNTLLKASAGYQKMLAIQTSLVTVAEEVQNKEFLKGYLAKKLNVTETEALEIAESFLALKKELLAKGTKHATQEAIKQTAANYGLAISEQAVLFPLLKFVAIAAAVVGGIYLIAKAYDHFTISAEEKAERAAKAYKALNEQAQAAQEQAKELNNSFESYIDTVKTLEDLTTGMEGFEEATKAVNDQTLELLEKYPELLKIEGILQGKPGGYSLDSDKFESFVDQKQQGAQALKGSVLYAKVDKEQADLDIEEKQLHDSILTESMQKADIGDLAKKTFGKVGEDFEEAVKDYGRTLGWGEEGLEVFYKQINYYSDQIQQLGKKQEQIATELDNVTDILAGITLGKDADSKQTEAYKATYDTTFKSTKDDVEEKLRNLSKTDGYDNAYLQDLQKKIQEKRIEFQFDPHNTVRGSGENRTLAGLDSEGKPVTLLPEQIAKIVAGIEAESAADTQVRENINADLEQKDIVLDEEVSTEVANSLLAELKGHFNEADFSELQESLEKAVTGLEQEKLIEAFIEKQETGIDPEEKRINDEGEKDAKDLGLDIKEFKAYRDLLKETTGDYDDNVKGLNEVALANKRMEKGVKTLAKDWKDYNEVMTSTNPSLEDMSAILPDINDGLQDILNISDEDFKLLPADFAKDNWSLIQDVMNGVEGSIDTLRDKAGEEILLSVGATVDKDGDKTVDQAFADLHNIIAAYDDSAQFKVGVNIDDQEFIGTCQRMIDQAGMTADQARAYFKSMGYNVELEEEATDVPSEYQYPNVSLDPVSKLPVIGDPDVITITTVNKVVGTAIKTITPSGSYGGDVNVKTTAPKAARTPKNSGGSKSKKKKKDSSNEIERYHVIEKQLDSLSRHYENLGKAKNSVFGKAKLGYIDDELKALDSLTKKQKEYTSAILSQAGIDQGKLSQYGAQFDADNNISNWDTIMEAQLKKYNNAVDAYNNGSLSEKAFEKAEKEYDDFKNYVKTYEETISQLYDSIDKEFELEQERISKELEKITLDIDLNIELDERSLKLLDHTVDKLSRNLDQMTEIIDAFGSQADIYLDQAKSIEGGIDSIRANAASEKRSLTEEEMDKIRDYENQLGSIKDSLLGLLDNVNESLLKEFDRLNDKLEENISRFDVYSNCLEHYTDIIKLSGRATKDSSLLIDLAAQRTDIAMETLNAANDKYLAQKEIQKEAAEKLAGATEDEDIKYWQEQYDKITKTVEQSHADMLASWKNALQAASEEFDQSVEISIQKFKEGFGKSGLDAMSNEYEQRKEVEERYLSDLDREYELNKLINKVENSIDDTDNIKGKEKLNSLLAEINEKQKKGAKITQYDLEFLQKRYELMQAENALEDVKNSKTTMRLMRNDQGNYDYVYTADQESVDKATSDYQDKLYELQKLSEDHVKELSDLIIQNQVEMTEALNGIDKNRADYQQEVDRITSQYLEKDKFLREELDKTIQNSNEILKIVAEETNQSYEDMAITYEKTTLGQVENAETLDEAQEKLRDNTLATAEEMKNAWTEWKEHTEDAMEEVGTSSDSFSSDIQADMSEIEGATDDLADSIDSNSNAMINSISNLMSKVQEWRNSYIAAINEMIRAYEEYLARTDKPVPPADRTPPKVTPGTGGGSGSGDNGGGSGNGSGSGGGSKPKPRLYRYMFNGPTNQPVTSGYEYTSEAAAKQGAKAAILSLAQEFRARGIYDLDKILIKVTKRFKSGGYTGAWGPEGKLAFLDEKELVLNKSDTENMLSAVNAVRAIGPNMFNQIKEFLNNNVLKNALMNLHSPNFNLNKEDSEQSKIEQNVTIQADFPNVSTANEIEEAFNNLLNDTIQYINIH